MKKVLALISIVLGGFGIQVVGSQQIVMNATADEKAYLQYVLIEKIKDFETFNLKAECNDPFIRMSITHAQEEMVVSSLGANQNYEELPHETACELASIANSLQNIKRLPFHYFLKADNAKKFKNKGDTLFSFTKEIDQKCFEFIVKLDSDFSKIPTDIISLFRCYIGYDAGDREKLIQNEILFNNEGIIVHGVNSYFGDEIINIIQDNKRILKRLAIVQPSSKKAINPRTLLRKYVCCGCLIAVVTLYVFYKKFYNTAH